MTSLPETGRLIGIDYGKARIGISISDPSQTISSPLEIYHPKDESKDGLYFLKLANEERAVGFVIGLPVHMSGDESEMSKATREFGDWLASTTKIPVAYIDERYTTAMAREVLNQSNLSGKKRKAQLDKLAAQIILASFLERREHNADQDPGEI